MTYQVQVKSEGASWVVVCETSDRSMARAVLGSVGKIERGRIAVRMVVITKIVHAPRESA